MSNNKIFNLVNFSPVGFKQVNYPVQFCPICRGKLTDICSICIESSNEKCNVINIDGSFYHYHCHNFINKNNNKK